MEELRKFCLTYLVKVYPKFHSVRAPVVWESVHWLAVWIGWLVSVLSGFFYLEVFFEKTTVFFYLFVVFKKTNNNSVGTDFFGTTVDSL